MTKPFYHKALLAVPLATGNCHNLLTDEKPLLFMETLLTEFFDSKLYTIPHPLLLIKMGFEIIATFQFLRSFLALGIKVVSNM